MWNTCTAFFDEIKEASASFDLSNTRLSDLSDKAVTCLEATCVV